MAPALGAPDGPVLPEPEPEREPMFGQGSRLPVAPDLDWEPDRPCPWWDGAAGGVALGVDVVPVEPVAPVAPVLPLGAAAAPAIPAAAPPVASAPATIVAPSSFDTCIGQTS